MSFGVSSSVRNYDTAPTLLIWPRHMLRLSVGRAGGRVLPVLEETAAQTNEYTLPRATQLDFTGPVTRVAIKSSPRRSHSADSTAPPAARRGCKEALWTKISKP